MSHDERCELRWGGPNPSCHCASRAFHADPDQPTEATPTYATALDMWADQEDQ